MDMYELLGKDSPEKVAIKIAASFKVCRKNKHITQKELAQKSMVPIATIRLFEQKGKISLSSLLLLSEALDIIDDFKLLFNPNKHRSYEDLVKEYEKN